ncbi:hypothetical protein SCACP_32910 [Sporomusa carbonis]|uniref:hypothetical protein n=1 Tax=Sporomusa carbonis TaxID=3076075 RepID=UPI003A5FE1A3
MNVRFIDTSILVNILDIPNMNDKHSQVIEEFQAVIKDKSQVLILPLATIIETGNHIAHISNGEIRRQKAKRMAAFLENTASGKAPWKYYGKELETDDLLWLAKEFPDNAMRQTGIGDLSIIRAYEKYKEEVPAIETIMIWSVDSHLSSYREEMTMPARRKNR